MAKGNFGERLKREREMREVTLNEVTVATRIAPRFLEAMENEDWGKLPGGVFNRGFVRSVARYLGLDEENLLAEYDMARGIASGDVKKGEAGRTEDGIPKPPKWHLLVTVLGIVVILAALVVGAIYGWRWFAHRKAQHSSARLATPVNRTSF
jgi:cytoskeletal protein RodZ